MGKDEFQERIRQLQEENGRLRQQLALKSTGEGISRGNAFIRKLIFSATRLIAGKGLMRSLNRLYGELPHSVTRDTMAEVSSYVFWRITRIGMFAICAAVIPILVLIVQTTILSIQNEKLDYQNELIQNQNVRLDQQVQLDEGNRRSSFIFLMSNIMDKIDEELKNSPRGVRKLSDELIGRIAALSQALLPYRYLENDQLTPGPLSPERGQLLFALVNSLLDEETYDKIYEKSNFSYAELKQANFSNAYLRNIHLEYAHFPDAVFNDVNLVFAKLNYANLADAHMEDVNLEGAQLKDVNLNAAEIANVSFANANLWGVDFSGSRINGVFTNARLDGVKLDGSEIEFALLDDAHFQSTEWMDQLNEGDLRGLFSIKENYQIEPEVIILSTTKTDTLFRLKIKEGSHLAIMGNCERRVLEIVKSAPAVEEIISRTKKQGQQIIYLTEANPFGSEDLDIRKDSIFLFRITTEDASILNVLMWIQFNPLTGELLQIPLTDVEEPVPLNYPRKMWQSLPDYCAGTSEIANPDL